jgi:hypothetical protein
MGLRNIFFSLVFFVNFEILILSKFLPILQKFVSKSYNFFCFFYFGNFMVDDFYATQIVKFNSKKERKTSKTKFSKTGSRFEYFSCREKVFRFGCKIGVIFPKKLPAILLFRQIEVLPK